ncbi:MAG: prepilin-type N-terminal cleavage/methylation domain-containing protein [Desulfomonile tiedjei]|nr:prepilin-type N-terminal cleavage/methylation domain-containing protein [Desulfomonile tiedjei]
MKASRSDRGFTVLEMVWALAVIAALGAIYFFFLESYKERRTGEQAAKVLMLAARAEEDYFAKELQYFDAEVSGNGGDTYLKFPDGKNSSVRVPERIVLSLKARDASRKAFTGHAFYTGGDVLHKYDSESGKIVTVSRIQEKTE